MKITNSWKKGLSGHKPLTKQQSAAKQDSIENPASNFDTPTTIVESTALSSGEKGEALKNWAEDAERLSVAADEGMTGGERSLLPEVKAAEAVLEQKIKADATTLCLRTGQNPVEEIMPVKTRSVAPKSPARTGMRARPR